MKRILIIDAHPASGSLCHALSDAYATGAVNAGHAVKTLRLRDLKFDPVLHLGYQAEQELEPDLKKAQEMILEAQHLVFVYPSWWGNVPALLKGFLDRAFLPGFAFRYRKNSPLNDKLLQGRSARIIMTMDAPRFWNRFMYRDANINALKRATLYFSGVKPVKTSFFTRVRFSDEMKRESWLKQTELLGGKGA